MTTNSKTNWLMFKEKIQFAVGSGFLPDSIKTPQQAFVIATKGEELGIPMMQAFSSIHVIKGKPTISAELMLALIYKNISTAEINFIQLDNTICKLEAKRNTKFSEFSFSIQDAQTAGLMSNHVWKKYPRAMLRSRCVSEMARSLFPDAIMGCSYTPEELGADIDLNDQGEAIMKEATQVAEPSKTPPQPPAEAKETIRADPEAPYMQAPPTAPGITQQVANVKSAVDQMKEKISENHLEDNDIDSRYGDYVCTVKKYKDTMLSQIPRKDLVNYVVWTMGKGLEYMKYKSVEEFAEKACLYLKIENGDTQRINYLISKYKANNNQMLYIDHTKDS